MSTYPYNTAAWQALRAAKLSADPLCEACIRREVVEQAKVVDHIIAIAKGGDPFPPLSGLMAMCEPCHNAKTNAVDHPNASGFRRALKGYDVDGNPIDPDGWEPAAFASRASTGLVPAGDTNKDLVLKLPNQEGELWV
ncbi:HNH endonuclease [Sinorhizobium meliloti]|uniref:HNH endonuclease n=1 Tax=Rhizobium meliloti TaxID=382 RepID=UPI000FDC9256|nr:HNH endonuclease signature motif containing protein [Sinorhizobium meliloti]RVO41072.1 HNH endonuclease [Sinorhizobium meliloti]